MLYKSDGFTPDDPFDSGIPLPPHIAAALRKKSDSPIDAETYEAQHGQSEPRFMVGGIAIPAGSTKDFIFDVNGLSLHSDYPIAPFQPLSSTWKGLTWQSFVSDLNELTIRVANVTNHSVTPSLQGFLVPGNHDYGSPGTEPPKTARTVKSVSGDADRLRSIFSEHPDLKAAAEEGTMRVSVSGSVERWEIVDGKSSHVIKRLKHVQIGEDQHDAIKESAARITALVEQHPYLANAIKDRWATVKVQDDGTLGIEFSQGRHVELSAFDESTSVSKAGAIGKAHRAHQEIEIALVGYRESRGERFDDAGI